MRHGRNRHGAAAAAAQLMRGAVQRARMPTKQTVAGRHSDKARTSHLIEQLSLYAEMRQDEGQLEGNIVEFGTISWENARWDANIREAAT